MHNLFTSSQLKTKTNLPNIAPSAFTHSVFPVPAGPKGFPPHPKCIAFYMKNKKLEKNFYIFSFNKLFMMLFTFYTLWRVFVCVCVCLGNVMQCSVFNTETFLQQFTDVLRF